MKRSLFAALDIFSLELDRLSKGSTDVDRGFHGVPKSVIVADAR
mgnify:CR=1 FL=1